MEFLLKGKNITFGESSYNTIMNSLKCLLD